MSRRDYAPGDSESMDAILASDRFIEQLRTTGTFEPSSREDAALAFALLDWRDDVRAEPITPPPVVDEIELSRIKKQPRRIARRSVAVAGALLVMSSAAATAFDGDPLRPVRFLVDLGVTVGEGIGNPERDSSTDGVEHELREVRHEGVADEPLIITHDQVPEDVVRDRDSGNATQQPSDPRDAAQSGQPGADSGADLPEAQPTQEAGEAPEGGTSDGESADETAGTDEGGTDEAPSSGSDVTEPTENPAEQPDPQDQPGAGTGGEDGSGGTGGIDGNGAANEGQQPPTDEPVSSPGEQPSEPSEPVDSQPPADEDGQPADPPAGDDGADDEAPAFGPDRHDWEKQLRDLEGWADRLGHRGAWPPWVRAEVPGWDHPAWRTRHH